MFEDIADTVLRRVLDEEENECPPIESRGSSTSSFSTTPSSSASPLSINQLLSSSFSQPPAPQLPVPLAFNPFQLALYQSLVANNTLAFPVFGGPPSIFPLLVPPPQPQPTVESIELLKILQNMLAKQKK
ncbi:Protein Upregulated in Glial Subsets [Caenorhabditis elegans]|nr:Uncharacterized protein CELE_W08E12.8 [Caenorhabditis elegans]CCD74018.1 Uncharacterized protein CELE_W08E12.8 [Caenorhabditis elegans]|eukprot:NP_001122803.1 Uncharacterized protein CELE_W08E12.8 [Caenorhabditis elegans]